MMDAGREMHTTQGFYAARTNLHSEEGCDPNYFATETAQIQLTRDLEFRWKRQQGRYAISGWE